MNNNKSIHFVTRLALLLFFAAVLSGTNYCQENYNIGAQFRGAESGSPTETPSSGVVDDDDNDPNDDGTELDDDGTDFDESPSESPSVEASVETSPSSSASTSPSPDSASTNSEIQLFNALARLSNNEGKSGDSAAKDSSGSEQQPFDLSSVTEKFEQLAGDSVGGSRTGESSATGSGSGGTWLGNLYDSEEIQGVSLDSDGDGYTDKLERDFGADPLDASSTPPVPRTRLWDRLAAVDSDLDGLSNDQERELGTDPNKGDSDGDGIRDGTEMVSSSNPLDQSSRPSDLDGDGLDTEYENEVGLNPQKNDTDEDGLRDDLELIVGSNPMDNDTDKDGIVDGKEIAHGADPVVPELNTNP